MESWRPLHIADLVQESRATSSSLNHWERPLWLPDHSLGETPSIFKNGKIKGRVLSGPESILHMQEALLWSLASEHSQVQSQKQSLRVLPNPQKVKFRSGMQFIWKTHALHEWSLGLILDTKYINRCFVLFWNYTCQCLGITPGEAQGLNQDARQAPYPTLSQLNCL